MRDKPNYYSILTSDVRYDKRLTGDEKVMYAEITTMANATGECWASNEWFSKNFKKSERTISRWIKKLEETGHITIRYEPIKGAGFREQRFIRIANIPVDKVVSTDRHECRVAGRQSCPEAGRHECLGNNTSNSNNTSNTIYTFKTFWNLYPRKSGNKKNAEEMFLEIVVSQELFDAILIDLEKRKGYENWIKDNGKWIPNALRYLENNMWEEEYESDNSTPFKGVATIL